MNSHIINPFKVDTQFTLQIHLIIDLITFKETVVFGSTGVQYCFYSPLLTFIGFLQKLVLKGLGNAWKCLTSPHLSVRTPPATTESSNLMRKSLLADLLGREGRCPWWAAQDGPHLPKPLSDGSPGHPSLEYPGEIPFNLLHGHGLQEALRFPCSSGREFLLPQYLI